MNDLSMIECLENRTLFAVSPTIQADLEAVHAELQQMQADRVAGLTLVAEDRRAVVNDRITASHGDPALVQKLHDDITTFAGKFKQDHANLAAVLATDRDALLSDEFRLRADRGNLSLMVADRARIASDLTQIRSDTQSFIARLLTDKSAQRTTVLTDLSDIANSRVSPTLTVDQQKLSSDALALQQTLSTDAQALASDRLQLVTDIRNHA